MERITLITTGGTIDKKYGSGKGVTDLHIGPPVAPRIFQRMRVPIFKIVQLFRKDSLHIEEPDRKKIAAACHQAATRCIIITHGTDTMVETAKAIFAYKEVHRENLAILTGALQPACIIGSDAEFNLGMAFGASQGLACSGIFIAMNGIRPWNVCRKDPRTGTFVYG